MRPTTMPRRWNVETWNNLTFPNKDTNIVVMKLRKSAIAFKQLPS